MAAVVGKYAAKKMLGKQMDKYRDKDVVPYVSCPAVLFASSLQSNCKIKNAGRIHLGSLCLFSQDSVAG